MPKYRAHILVREVKEFDMGVVEVEAADEHVAWCKLRAQAENGWEFDNSFDETQFCVGHITGPEDGA